MDTIKKFDRRTCDIVRTALDAAVQTVAQTYGLQIKAGNGTFSSTGDNFTIKVECATKGEDGTVNTKEAEDYIHYCSRWDLEPEYLNKTFVDVGNGNRYKIIGAKPRSKKYPILVQENSSGMLYKFPASRVARAFGATEVGVALSR